MIDTLLQLDTKITLFLNGSDSNFLDSLFWIITKTRTWFPLAAVLLYSLWRKHSWKQTLLLLAMVGLCILLADRVASGWAKPFFARFRPTQEPALAGMVDMVRGYTGGKYGFFSSHGANSSVLFMFFSLLYRRKSLTWLLLLFTLINGYSRIYLGVHYFGDVLVGTVWGCVVGYAIYRLYSYIVGRYNTLFTVSPTDYTHADSTPLVQALLFTYAMIVAVASGVTL